MKSLILTGLLATGAAAAEAARPTVEVVFVLDTTSSMGGLIEGAKQRIWAIANEVAKGKPAPRVRMGLVAFRDKGDEYVTKVFDLTENLDKTYQDLLSLQVGGGGDGPEHVIAGLEAAIDQIAWSADAKAFKVVYLVGDAPPHEDYPEAPKLSTVLERAVRKGLIVNGVVCGGDPTATASFERVAKGAEGRLLRVPQDGGMAAVATPHDGALAALSTRLEGTGLAFGAARGAAASDLALSRGVAARASAPAAAERAMFKTRKGFSAESDLAEAVAANKLELKDLKEDELPEALKSVPAEERASKLAQVSAERKALRARFAELSAKRAAWLKDNAKTRRSDAFDARLVDSLKVQARAKGIVY